MEMGENERGIIMQAYRSRQPLPKRIQDAPRLRDGEVFYFNAFLDLMTDRPIGFGVAPIPWSAIIRYADEAGLEGVLRDDFKVVMRLTDDGFLKWSASKRAQDDPAKNRGAFRGNS